MNVLDRLQKDLLERYLGKVVKISFYFEDGGLLGSLFIEYGINNNFDIFKEINDDAIVQIILDNYTTYRIEVR